MRPLIIRPEEKQAIADAVARARAKPIDMAMIVRNAIPDSEGKDLVTLADRKPEMERPPSQFVDLPVGYRLAISFEDQPAAMCLHVSMSVNAKGKLPNPHAIEMMLDEVLANVGGSLATMHPVRTWLEEFKIDGAPGGHAFNALFLIGKARGGSA